MIEVRREGREGKRRKKSRGKGERGNHTLVSTVGNLLLMCLMAESSVLSERHAGRVVGSRHD